MLCMCPLKCATRHIKRATISSPVYTASHHVLKSFVRIEGLISAN